MRDTLIRDLGAELRKLMASARAVALEAAGGVHPEISSAGFQILQWLSAFGPTKASALADALSMDRSAVSRLARELRRLDLLVIRPDDSDGRSVQYALAESARGRIADAIASKGNAFESRLASWTDTDIDELTLLLRRLNEPVA